MNRKMCKNKIVADSVTYSNSQLLIDIPVPTTGYYNGCTYCLEVSQAIPATATVAAPVYITIGGVTTTTYPLLNCNGIQLTASQICTRMCYGVKVVTNATSGSFMLTAPLNCNCAGGALPSLPVASTTTGT